MYKYMIRVKQADYKVVHNEDAADTTNANELHTGGSLGLTLDGTGVVCTVFDEGLARATHQELTGRIDFEEAATAQADHSCHVTGTIIASGVNTSAKGMAPNTHARNYSFNNDFSSTVTSGEWYLDADSTDISNHSYGQVLGWVFGDFGLGFGSVDHWFGDIEAYITSAPGYASNEDANFGKYTSYSRDIDHAAFLKPNVLQVWSAGNDRNDDISGGATSFVAFSTISGWTQYTVSGGNFEDVNNPGNFHPVPPSDFFNSGVTGFDTIGPSSVIKNGLVIGSILDFPTHTGDFTTSTFSGYGATDDGRIAPQIVGNGQSLLSCITASDSAYGNSSGTSMAAPNVTGSLCLLIEHYRNITGKTGRDKMTSATLKALAIICAYNNDKGPSFSYGYGLLDAEKCAQFLTEWNNDNSNPSMIFENTYSGTAQTITIRHNDISKKLKVAICWTDYTDGSSPISGSGIDEGTSPLVNKLRIKAGDEYPWSLDKDNPTNAATRTGYNTTDNAQVIEIDPVGSETTYVVTVDHDGSLTGGSQNYSLLLTNSVNVDNVPICFLKGTKVLTKDGYRLIEEVKKGDCITSDNNEEDEVIDCYYSAHLPKRCHYPYVIPKGCEGCMEDVCVSPNHKVQINGRMKRAKECGFKIRRDLELIEYYHLRLKKGGILIANGLVTESWSGYDNRKYKTYYNNYFKKQK